MDPSIKSGINSWISQLLNKTVSYTDLRDGKLLCQLIDLSENYCIESKQDFVGISERVIGFLDSTFYSGVSSLFNVENVIDGKTEEMELYALYITVLLGCLQSRSSQSFMNAAISLDLNTQNVIFHLIKEPMTQLSMCHKLTREMILSKFQLSDHCDAIDDSNAVVGGELAHSTFTKEVQESEDENSEFLEFKVPDPVNYKRGKFDGHDFEKFSIPGTPCEDLNNGTNNIDSRRHPSACDSIANDNCSGRITRSSSKSTRRPTDLPLTVNITDHHSLSSSLIGDRADVNGNNHDLKQLPPASPLTSLKNLLDSPSWTHKTQLRECEREKRRLLTELDKERAYRDEVEGLVAGLRRQIEESRLRATKAESRATRLTHELAALHDQGDELANYRAELTVRQEEITNLKERLNGMQELLFHSRNLKLENSKLQQENADYRLKVDELSSKLKENKERRIMCSEVETLRSKLRDVEAQLAQQLLERQTMEQDRRLQQEMFTQLKLQQSMVEKRKALNMNMTVKSQETLSEIEFDHATKSLDSVGVNNLETVKPDGVLIESSSSTDVLFLLKTGENLGGVLENELRSACSKISKLESQHQQELENAKQLLSEKSNRVHELEQLIIEYQTKPVQIDCAIQTSELERTKSVEKRISESSDERLDSNHERSLPKDTYEVCADDRRGLSDELVRLHEELSQSHAYSLHLEQQISDLQSQLYLVEKNLESQTTLANRAQQHWIMSENECRKALDQLASLRAQQDSVSSNGNPSQIPDRSYTEAQVAVLKTNHEKEQNDLRQKLRETTFELEKSDADRSRLTERNNDLQRELETLRKIFDAYIQNQNVNSNKSTNSVNSNGLVNHINDKNNEKLRNSLKKTTNSIRVNGCLSDSLEDWLENVHEQQYNLGSKSIASSQSISNHNNHNRNSNQDCNMYQKGWKNHSDYNPDRSNFLSGDEDQDSFIECSYKSHAEKRKHHSQNTVSYNSSHHHNCNRNGRKNLDSKLSTHSEQLARLASRTAELEKFAVKLRQNVDQHHLSNQLNGNRSSAPGISTTLCPLSHHHYPVTNGESDLSYVQQINSDYRLNGGSIQQEPVSAPVLSNHNLITNNNIQQYDRDQDTDADSSAYTDLSQVSPISQVADLGDNYINNHIRNQNSLPVNNSYGVKSNSQVNIINHNRTSDIGELFIPQSILINSDSSRSRLTSSAKSLRHSSPISTDLSRITELHLRNRLQPLHLRSSYPIETQVVNTNEVMGALERLKFNSSAKSVTDRCSNSDTEHILREMTEENVPNSINFRIPTTISSLSRKGIVRSRKIRENLESEVNSSPLAAGYHPKPRNLDSITEALIAASDDPDSMITALTAKLSHPSYSLSNLLKQQQQLNSDQSIKPTHTNNSSEISQSNQTNLQSNKLSGSIAFEIPNDNKSVVRRLPTSRVSTVHKNSNMDKKASSTVQSVGKQLVRTNQKSHRQAFPGTKMVMVTPITDQKFTVP